MPASDAPTTTIRALTVNFGSLHRAPRLYTLRQHTRATYLNIRRDSMYNACGVGAAGLSSPLDSLASLPSVHVHGVTSQQITIACITKRIPAAGITTRGRTGVKTSMAEGGTAPILSCATMSDFRYLRERHLTLRRARNGRGTHWRIASRIT